MVESLSQYDEEAAGYIREGQIRQHHKEKALHDLVELCDKSRLDPRLIIEIVLQELKRRTEIMRRHLAKEE